MNTPKPASPPSVATPKPHLIHLISSLGNGGCENMLLVTLPQLTHFRHTIITIKDKGQLADSLSAQGLKVISLNLKHYFDFPTYLRLFRTLQTHPTDILVTYLPLADLVGRVLGRLAGIRTIVCSVRAKLTRSPLWPLYVLDGLTSFLVTHYHFNSPVTARIYQQYFFLPRRKMSMIPNGIDLKTYTSATSSRLNLRDLSLSSDHTIIGCVAQLRHQKGHRYLLTATSRLLTTHQKITLVIVGTGRQLTSIQKQIKRLKIDQHVVLLGNRPDVPAILPLFDIFVLPTLFEGMSRAILEAMAAARPIVTTNIPENKVILTDGYNALLVKPRHVPALTHALSRLITNTSLRSSLAQTAYVAAQQYDISHTVRQLNSMYTRLINRT